MIEYSVLIPTLFGLLGSDKPILLERPGSQLTGNHFEQTKLLFDIGSHNSVHPIKYLKIWQLLIFLLCTIVLL